MTEAVIQLFDRFVELKLSLNPIGKDSVVLFHYMIAAEHFRIHYDRMVETIKYQTECMRRLSKAQRLYMQFEPKLPIICTSAEYEQSIPLIKEILLDIRFELGKIHVSNESLGVGINDLRQTYRSFEQHYQQLDLNDDTDIIKGDQFHKPISFYLEFLMDIFKYFMAFQMRLKYLEQLMDPDEEKTLHAYQEQLVLPEDFIQFFVTNLHYCKCLKPKPQCNIFKQMEQQTHLKNVYKSGK